MDKQKIIKALELCSKDTPIDECINACTYYNCGNEYGTCTQSLMRDALELLKSQEQEIDFLKQMQLSIIQNTKMDEQTLGMMVSHNMRRFKI